MVVSRLNLIFSCFFSPAPPRFVSRLESACLIEGEDIQFSCSTFTTPLPRIRYRSAELTAVVALRFCNYCVSECSAACSWQVVEGWQRVDWPAEILDYEWCTERDPVSDRRQGNWSRYWAVRVWGIKHRPCVNTAGVTNVRALPLICMEMFYFVQLWNELGGVKCKAGLCPAYVPPTDRENDQSQDLPPKGKTVTANEVNILHLGWEPIRAFLSGWGSHCH